MATIYDPWNNPPNVAKKVRKIVKKAPQEKVKASDGNLKINEKPPIHVPQPSKVSVPLKPKTDIQRKVVKKSSSPVATPSQMTNLESSANAKELMVHKYDAQMTSQPDIKGHVSSLSQNQRQSSETDRVSVSHQSFKQ